MAGFPIGLVNRLCTKPSFCQRAIKPTHVTYRFVSGAATGFRGGLHRSVDDFESSIAIGHRGTRVSHLCRAAPRGSQDCGNRYDALTHAPSICLAFFSTAVSARDVHGSVDHSQHIHVREHASRDASRGSMTAMGLLLLIILLLLLIGGLPTWPYSRRWGYGPSGALGTLLVILLILVLLDYVPRGF
jgi:hypothetical protein